MKHGISKNEMRMSIGISFFKMPCGILCFIRILPNTLRKILEVLHFCISNLEFNSMSMGHILGYSSNIRDEVV
jgi:hypothetical protein